MHYCPVVLFIRLQKIVQTSKTVDGIHKAKATEQLLPVVLFIMLYEVFLTSESADENNALVFYKAVFFCFEF